MSTTIRGNQAHSGARGALRLVIGTAALLLVPLLAMRFTDEVRWGGGDFLAAAVLLLGAGFSFQVLMRCLPGTRQRLLGAAVLGLAFVYIWAELAVGILFHFGS